MSDQNPICRRAYVVRPRPELIAHLEEAGEADAISDLATVVMTEPLPFEGGLESFRTVILERCKQAFLAELYEFEPFDDTTQRDALLGVHPTASSMFDAWWTAEEVETLEIETDWLPGRVALDRPPDRTS